MRKQRIPIEFWSNGAYCHTAKLGKILKAHSLQNDRGLRLS